MLLCFVVYLLVGASGYLYGVVRCDRGIVPGDALQMYPEGGVDVIVARCCIAVSVVASYVTLHFTSSKCLEDVLLRRGRRSGGGGGGGADEGRGGGVDGAVGRKGKKVGNSSQGQGQEQEQVQKHGGFSPKQRAVEVVVFLAVTVGLSMVVQQLDLVLGVMGSVTVVPFMFVVPGLMQAELDRGRDRAGGACLLSLKGRHTGHALAALGAALSVAGLVVTLAG